MKQILPVGCFHLDLSEKKVIICMKFHNKPIHSINYLKRFSSLFFVLVAITNLASPESADGETFNGKLLVEEL